MQREEPAEFQAAMAADAALQTSSFVTRMTALGPAGCRLASKPVVGMPVLGARARRLSSRCSLRSRQTARPKPYLRSFNEATCASGNCFS